MIPSSCWSPWQPSILNANVSGGLGMDRHCHPINSSQLRHRGLRELLCAAMRSWQATSGLLSLSSSSTSFADDVNDHGHRRYHHQQHHHHQHHHIVSSGSTAMPSPSCMLPQLLLFQKLEGEGACHVWNRQQSLAICMSLTLHGPHDRDAACCDNSACGCILR